MESGARGNLCRSNRKLRTLTFDAADDTAALLADAIF